MRITDAGCRLFLRIAVFNSGIALASAPGGSRFVARRLSGVHLLPFCEFVDSCRNRWYKGANLCQLPICEEITAWAD